MKVTLISNEEKSSHVSKEQGKKLNEWFLAALREMDYTPFTGKYQTAGLAKRPENGTVTVFALLLNLQS